MRDLLKSEPEPPRRGLDLFRANSVSIRRHVRIGAEVTELDHSAPQRGTADSGGDMARQLSTLAAITALLGLMCSCSTGGVDAGFDKPPESTYVVKTGRLQYGDTLAEVQLGQVTEEFFAVVNRLPFLGRGFIAEDFEERAEPGVLLSHELWDKQLGGRPQIIGGTLQLDGRDRTVLGVMPPGIEWPPGVQLWIPRSSPP
ncbi:MAG TPA: ABC transporter permease [Thermoanaerobaculia bacterium]|nr:ABC transporter permease [Thermoanaerobaculia bacterium]